MDAAVKDLDGKVPAADLKQIIKAVSWREETTPPVIAKREKLKPARPITPDERLAGLFPDDGSGIGSQLSAPNSQHRISFEPDPDLRDTEQIPLLEPGGIDAFIRHEVLPYTPDAWVKADATKIGYEVSFTRHLYQPAPLRTLDEIRTDILAVEKEAAGLLSELLHGGA